MVTQDWMPQISQPRCDGCGACIIECPTNALGWFENKAILAYPDKCIYCAACETICPQNTIELPYLILRKSVEDLK
jgi:NAD-dependent dihydropyrimidine dehydrogenase PreA subunit